MVIGEHSILYLIDFSFFGAPTPSKTSGVCSTFADADKMSSDHRPIIFYSLKLFKTVKSKSKTVEMNEINIEIQQ